MSLILLFFYFMSDWKLSVAVKGIFFISFCKNLKWVLPDLCSNIESV